MNRRLRIAGAGLAAVAAGLLLTWEPVLAARSGGCESGCCGNRKVGKQGGAQDSKPVEAARGADSAKGEAIQKATVVIDGGYSPETITVESGRPVELTFIRKEKRGCGDVVQFPSLGLKRTVESGRKARVTFTPKKAGTVPFTCAMEMYEGKVIVR